MNALAVGATRICCVECCLKTAPNSSSSSPSPRIRRGHATTTPREDCARSKTGTAGGGCGLLGPDIPVIAVIAVAPVTPVTPGAVPPETTTYPPAGGVPTHGATRSSVCSPNLATPHSLFGDTRVARKRITPPCAPPLDEPPPGQNGNAWSSPTIPTCESAVRSNEFACSMTSAQSLCVSGDTS
jgi:hypothetical protein